MERKRLRLTAPVVVEGRYDKARLAAVVETPVIVLNGFGIFNDAEKQALLRRLAAENGLIILTDSDRAGAFLRARLRGLLGGARLINVYAPVIAGKEKRKARPSKEGVLGVEGVDCDRLYEALLPFAAEGRPEGAALTRAEFYADGFLGGVDSASRRAALARALSLPQQLTSGALLEAINLLYSRAEYERAKAGVDTADMETKREER